MQWASGNGQWTMGKREITHPSLPKGEEQVTPADDFSPHLASPEGEVQIALGADYQLFTNNGGGGSNLHLPYEGEREGLMLISGVTHII